MAQIYVWRPEGVSLEEAEDRFARVLNRQRLAGERAFGSMFDQEQRRVGRVFVGAIRTDLGVRNWLPWVRASGMGLAWSGVCEDFLGVTWHPSRVVETATALLDRPSIAEEWRGSFAVVAWDEAKERVAVVTGAAQSQTVWRTDGRGGWSCGSRARPLLELVGRTPELDPVQASLFVSFGYLAGTGSLFRHVERLPSRRHVAVELGTEAVVREYVGVAEFLNREGLEDASLRDSVLRSAERYVARVAKQRRYSVSPILSLTGGRDSRSIAAALAYTGSSVPARTGGLPESEDVVLAAQVARELGFAHELVSTNVAFVERLHGSIAQSVAWSELSEGVETIRHALHYSWFFEHDSQRRPVEQNFNGLRPFLNRRHAPGWQRADLRSKISEDLRHQRDALANFDAMAERLDREVTEAGGSAIHFAELHFWQVKVLHSGQDNLLVKDMVSHWWTPLVDATLIRANWHLPTDHLPRATFIESITSTLAPQLDEIRYQGTHASPLAKLLAGLRRAVPHPFRPIKKPSFAVSAERRHLWEEILFLPEALAWPDLIEPTVVRRALQANRSGQLLWNLATIELFARAHLAGNDSGAWSQTSLTPMPSPVRSSRTT